MTARQPTHLAKRAFSSSSAILARGESSGSGSGSGSGSAVRARPWAVQHTPKYNFDDPTSLGWMRMFRIQEGEGLVRKVVEDKEALRAANKTSFAPPPSTSSIRLTTTIDLSSPNSRFHTKSVLLVPVSSLPLSSPESVHRLKLLAGPRWSPGRPGRDEFLAVKAGEGEEEGKEGWLKIAEERFGNKDQNRRSGSDILERLVLAANDPNSPIPADTPLDTRHLIARQKKKRSRPTIHAWTSDHSTALPQQDVVGGVKGFPLRWLSEEQRAKAVAGSAA